MLSTRRAGILTSGLSVVDMDRQTSIFATTNLRQGMLQKLSLCRRCVLCSM